MPLLSSHKPRHAKPSKAAPTLMAVSTAGGMTATLGALAAPAQAATATADDFARLRQCESGGNYSTNTGNGYYGAYQFNLSTWHGLGYPGYPHTAAPATQDQAAHQLQADRGWSPWPACSRRLGLGEARASRGGARTVLVGTPHFTETLSKQLVHEKRADVRAWQARMKQRGWDIRVDGRFGAQSAGVAARFAAEKGIRVTPGTVDRVMWQAAWELPVT